MPEALFRLQQQAMEIWNEMDKSQRTKMLVIAILVIASISIAIYMITRPNYEKLFSGSIDAKEIGEMSKVLKDNKIDHKLSDGGTSIEVKNKDKDMAQVVLAQSGYPQEGMTFKDALSSIKLSTTESDKKKIFKEYDEQKIANSLKKIDNISDAVVNLSLPEQTDYLGPAKEQEPSAAVLVEPRSDLSQKQIKGIERLVAASVEGLQPKNVRVIDKNSGNMLNDGAEDDIQASTNSQYEFQMVKKKEVEDKVRDLLGNMYDGVKVGANVVCDFDSLTTKQVEYIPVVGNKSGILRSTQTSKEIVQNGSNGGVPGTDSNGTGTPSYQTENNSGSGYSKVDETSNYDITQKNTESVKAPGQMDVNKSSITVSLLYGLNIPNPPAQTEIDTITKMIANATGIAGNNITIASFKLPPVKTEKSKTDWTKLLSQILPISVLGILIILLAIGIMKKSSGGSRQFAYNMSGSNINLVAGGDTTENLQEIELEETSEVKKQIDKFVKRKPDAVAQLLRNWLADDDWG